ncbi:CaiB/BaiF CoA transferase family protein [Chloroflexota bacterium]
METRYALEGLKVVDFSWIFTGPIATTFLADNGAEVIKIESATRPDGTRMLKPFKDGIEGLNRSGIFANYNSGKLSMNLNLRDPRAIELAKKLVARADIVLETFSPGVMKKLGLDYKELRRVKPDIIMTSMTMFGQYGPCSQQPAIGQFLQASSGFVHLLGWPDRPPALPASPYTDYIAPWFVLMSLMAALDFRHRTGKGQYIDLSMQEASVHFLTPELLDYIVNGRVQNRVGNRHPTAAPHGVYPCKGNDRWCTIAVFNNKEWQILCKLMDNPKWAIDPRFASILGRTQNSECLDRLIAEWTIKYPPEKIMATLQDAGVPAGIVETGEDLVNHDPQLKHRQHFVVLDHPEMGPHLAEKPPFSLSKASSGPQRPAPCFGEHTEYVCHEILGMRDEEFTELVAAGVLS